MTGTRVLSATPFQRRDRPKSARALPTSGARCYNRTSTPVKPPQLASLEIGIPASSWGTTSPQTRPTTLNQNRFPRPERMKIARATIWATIPTFAVAVMVVVACNGPQPVTPPEDAAPTAVPEPPPVRVRISTPIAVPEPTPTRLPVDGATWILAEVDGRPLADGMYATLTIDGSQFDGFDGCNLFGGRHESGQPVVKRNGQISMSPYFQDRRRLPNPRNSRPGKPVSGSHGTAGHRPRGGRPVACYRPFW